MINEPRVELPVLGDLIDPLKYTDPIVIDKNSDPSMFQEQLKKMILIRRSEEKIGDMIQAGKIVCPCHLAIGQEAVAVASAQFLRPTDRVFGTHRSHSHFLAMGGSPFALFAEILGKEAGCSKGMGGSMHLYDESIGFKGSVPIVAATVSLGVGAGLAARLDKSSDCDLGVSYFGDGAIEEGGVHESLNFAAKFKTPMIFVCENNLFSSHLHIQHRQPGECVSRFAAAHKMNFAVVDGNDVTAVGEAMKELTQAARAGEGPGFLEAVTYRWRGHVGPREDIDVGLKRSEDLQQWKKRDPIRRLKEGLQKNGILSEDEFKKANEEIAALVEDSWQQAEQAPFPKEEALMNLVYRQEH